MSQPIDADKIRELKQRLVVDRELSRFWDYFLSDFGENPLFLEMGRACKSTTVEELIAMLGRKLFSKDQVAISNVSFAEIPEFALLHGACLLEGRITNVLYFSNIKAGVVGVCMDFGRRTVFARITQAQLEKLKPASGRVQ